MISATADLDLGDYLKVLRRRKYQFVVPFTVVVVVSILLAFLLPARYRSEATLLIERQTIPTDLVETTVTGFVQERIQQITQTILTFDSLVAIAEEHGIYTDIIKTNPEKAVRMIRDEDFSLDMLDVESRDPNKPGAREATIAFTVAFTASTPEAARAITKDLSDRYLEQNDKQRKAQTEKVSEFLESKAGKLSAEIKILDAQIAEFKKLEQNNLPEVLSLNRSLYEKAEQQIEATRDRIRDIEGRIDTANAELAVTPLFEDVRTDTGAVILSSQDRMNSLVAQYVRATSRYSARHPDVIRLAREIRSLADQSGNAGRIDELMEELIRQQEQLRQAQQKYGIDHPDVAQLQRAVSGLEASFQRSLATDSESPTAKPNNPRYVSLHSQLESFKTSLIAENLKLGRYEEKQAEYEKRLTVSPFVESEYVTLTRELDTKISEYNELNDKQNSARIAQELEAGEGAERFSLANPATLPSLPESPNRVGIVLLGMLLAGVLGLIVVALAEYLDDAIHDERTLASILGVAPLAVIPRI